MIDRSGNARLMLESRRMVFSAAKICAQELQRHKPIEQRIPRLVNAAHAANAQHLDDLELIKRSLHPRFLAALGTNHTRQRLISARINGRAASRTSLGHGALSSIDMEMDCYIDEFLSKEMASLKPAIDTSTMSKLMLPKADNRHRSERSTR